MGHSREKIILGELVLAMNFRNKLSNFSHIQKSSEGIFYERNLKGLCGYEQIRVQWWTWIMKKEIQKKIASNTPPSPNKAASEAWCFRWVCISCTRSKFKGQIRKQRANDRILNMSTRRLWIYQYHEIRVIRIRKSKDIQHNGQKKKKSTNNDLQNIHIKLKIE